MHFGAWLPSGAAAVVQCVRSGARVLVAPVAAKCHVRLAAAKSHVQLLAKISTLIVFLGYLEILLWDFGKESLSYLMLYSAIFNLNCKTYNIFPRHFDAQVPLLDVSLNINWAKLGLR